MLIEKFVHSCIRVARDGEKLLFDPGKFSFVDGRVDPRDLADASTVLITHDHPDHLDVEALKIIVAGRGATILGNGAVARRLSAEGLAVSVFESGVQRHGPFELQAIPVQHEPVLSEHQPAVTAVVVNDRLLNCADS